MANLTKKNIALCIQVASLCFFLISPLFAQDKVKEIGVGVIGPMSGEGATYGQAMKRGIDMALEEINTGGNGSFRLKAIYEDDKLTAKDGINAFNKLSQIDKVPIIFGSAGSSVSLAIAPFANKNKVVLFSSISSADSLKDAGEYFFRNIPPNKIQAVTAALFVKEELKKSSACVFYENNDYGLNMLNEFSTKFKGLGGSIPLAISYESKQSDFKNLLYKIKAKNPDVIYIPGTYQENALIIRQARQLGMNSVLMGGDGAYSPQLINIAGDAAEGFYCTLMSVPPKEKSRAAADFHSAYEKKYKEEPNVYSAYSYDAVKMVAEAIDVCLKLKKSSPSGEDVKEVLQKIWHEGVSGRTFFDQNGQPIDKYYSVYAVKKGKFSPLSWSPQ